MKTKELIKEIRKLSPKQRLVIMNIVCVNCGKLCTDNLCSKCESYI